MLKEEAEVETEAAGEECIKKVGTMNDRVIISPDAMITCPDDKTIAASLICCRPDAARWRADTAVPSSAVGATLMF